MVGGYHSLDNENDDIEVVVISHPPPSPNPPTPTDSLSVTTKSPPENHNLIEHLSTSLPVAIQSIQDAIGFQLIYRGLDADVIIPFKEQPQEPGASTGVLDLAITVSMSTGTPGSELRSFNFLQNAEHFMSITLGNTRSTAATDQLWHSGDIFFSNSAERVGYLEICGDHNSAEAVRVHSKSGTSFILAKQPQCSSPTVVVLDSHTKTSLATASALTGHQEIRRVNVSFCCVPVPVHENRVVSWNGFAMALSENGKQLTATDKGLLIAGLYAWMIKMKGTECQKRRKAKSGHAYAGGFAFILVLGFFILKVILASSR